VWVAEVMLQQTRVEAAAPYYRRFLARWPTLRALAGADDGEVLAAWSGLGYYARCRNLLAAARTALSRHGGLPASLEALRALPGFGPYTAGAVASIAFGLPEAAVDGNAARVLSRLFLIDGPSQSPKVKHLLASLAGGLVDPGRPGDWNQALMELGATLCLPRRPRCAPCPLARGCAAREAGREAEIPAPKVRPRPVRMELSLLRVERGGRLLLCRAGQDGLFPGMWGLPGPVVPGLALEVGEELAVVTRLLTHRRLVLRVHAGRLLGPGPSDPDRLRFTSEDEASRLPASTAMRRAIEASGGWNPVRRRDRGATIVSGKIRKALTSRG
jgi:A/G-specific adenine glycosylase